MTRRDRIFALQTLLVLRVLGPHAPCALAV